MSTTVPITQPTARTHPARGQILNVAAGIGLMAGAFATLRLDGSTVDWLVKEDSLVEWTGAIALLIGSGLFFASFLLARRHRPAPMAAIGAWVLLAIAGSLFFFFGEEISWGQRIFGFGTPETISGVNAQDETTFHNINFLQGGMFDGDRLFRLWWITLFVLLPVLAWVLPRLRDRLAPLVPLVPLWLVTLFVASWVLGLIALNVFDSGYDALYPISHAISEIQESAVEVMMAIAGLLSLREVLRSQPPPVSDAPRPVLVERDR